jgi:hypothetical protein
MNVRTDNRNGIVSRPEAQRSAGQHAEQDIRLEPLPEPSGNGFLFWLVASSNQRIVRMGIGYNGAADYLSQLAIPSFQVDLMLYAADRWARRQGSQRPLYELREGDKPACWDVLTESPVGVAAA